MNRIIPKLYVYSLLGLFFVGCRGCSCNIPKTYILESIVEEIQLDSQHIAKVQIEHLKKTGFGFTFKFKKHNTKSSYAVRYNLQIDDRPYRNEIFEQDAVETDSMSQHRKDISLAISDDQQHLLVKFEQQTIGVYHLLPEGMPFTTSIEPKAVKKLAKNFNNNNLKSPVDYMLAYVQQTTDIDDAYNNKYIQGTLTAQKSPCVFDDSLLLYIGKPLADVYFASDGRTSQLALKNKKWRQKATSKVYQHIRTVSRARFPLPDHLREQAGGAINLFNSGLSGYMNNRAIERQVLPLYPLHDFAVELYKKEVHRTLRKNEVKSIEKNCHNLLSNPELRDKVHDPALSVNESIEFLIQYRDVKNLKSFEKMMAAVFSPPIIEMEPRNLEDEILFPYDTRFSEAEQAIILQYARAAYDLQKKEDKIISFHLKNFINKIDDTPADSNQTEVPLES